MAEIMAQAVDKGRKRVVVIEDDEDFQVLLNMILAPLDVDVIPARGGKSGVAAIQASRPHVVILDLSLPDMHGWEVYMQMRAEPWGRDIPVIIITGQGTRHDRNFSLQVAQVHDFLTKPFMPSQLRRSVTAALAGREEN